MVFLCGPLMDLFEKRPYILNGKSCCAISNKCAHCTAMLNPRLCTPVSRRRWRQLEWQYCAHYYYSILVCAPLPAIGPTDLSSTDSVTR